MWAVFFLSQCLLLSEFAAVYYIKKDLTEISLKGYSGLLCWLMKLSIAFLVVNQLVVSNVSS